MTFSFRRLGLLFLVCALAVSALANAYLLETIKKTSAENGVLNGQLASVVASNEGMVATIEQIREEKKAAQKTADALMAKRAEAN